MRLQASYAADPSGAALLGMGEAERQLDRPAEAYRDYEKALAAPAGDLQPADREAAQRTLGELAAQTGTVKATVSEAGAAVAVDGRPLGADDSGHPLHLSPGRHVLEASKPGFETLTFPIWVTAGKELQTSLTLKPTAGARPVAPVAAPAPPPPISTAPRRTRPGDAAAPTGRASRAHTRAADHATPGPSRSGDAPAAHRPSGARRTAAARASTAGHHGAAPTSAAARRRAPSCRATRRAPAARRAHPPADTRFWRRCRRLPSLRCRRRSSPRRRSRRPRAPRRSVSASSSASWPSHVRSRSR